MAEHAAPIDILPEPSPVRVITIGSPAIADVAALAVLGGATTSLSLARLAHLAVPTTRTLQ